MFTLCPAAGLGRVGGAAAGDAGADSLRVRWHLILDSEPRCPMSLRALSLVRIRR